jgi:hypothetical protein
LLRYRAYKSAIRPNSETFDGLSPRACIAIASICTLLFRQYLFFITVKA